MSEVEEGPLLFLKTQQYDLPGSEAIAVCLSASSLLSAE